MAQPQGSDRRRAPRAKVSQPLVVVVDSARSQIANRAFALDLSDMGARIRSEIHLQPGQLVTVIPNEGAEQGIPSQVIWVERSGAHEEAGIAFLQPLGTHS